MTSPASRATPDWDTLPRPKHDAAADNLHLPFALLSDATLTVARALDHAYPKRRITRLHDLS